jgi:hypothetical protein
MLSDKGKMSNNAIIIMCLCLLWICLWVVTSVVFAASGPGPVPGKAKPALRVLDPVGVLSEPDSTQPPAPRLKGLSGKKVWVVVVDSGSTLMPAVAKLLPQYAPGGRVKTIVAGEKGNPFFMLKPEDKPDAVIAGTGVCEASTLEALNYAKQSEKLDIPAVISFNAEMLFAYQEAMDKLKLPNVRPYATSLPDPARPGDSERLARLLIPQLIEGLTRSPGTDRPRICFTGTGDKAQAYFEALRWTGGVPVVLPTEERVAALLKGTSRRPAEVAGVMAPGMRQATVEKVAVLAVMAGCTPEQVPLALALAELLCQKKVAEELGKRQSPVLQIALAGAAAGTIGAPGSPTENAIGKLARLMLIHLAGVPGPALEQKRIWATVPEQGNAGGESTVALIDVDRAEIWKQSTTAVDKWR